MHVEDHPIEYNTFEGVIPAHQYGAGPGMIWERIPEEDPQKGLDKGHLTFRWMVNVCMGVGHLVRMNRNEIYDLSNKRAEVFNTPCALPKGINKNESTYRPRNLHSEDRIDS